jgi:hypothetical protein
MMDEIVQKKITHLIATVAAELESDLSDETGLGPFGPGKVKRIMDKVRRFQAGVEHATPLSILGPDASRSRQGPVPLNLQGLQTDRIPSQENSHDRTS